MPTNGTPITPNTPAHHVLPAQTLTAQGIMAKYGMSQWEFNKTKEELGQMKLLDILFSYPDGPCYDVALYMVATSR